MHRAGMAILMGALFAGSAGAHARKDAEIFGHRFPQGSAEAVSLASGTPLFAELDTSVDSKKAKAGDPVTAHLTEAVKVDGGTVIPKNAKLVGHVTQASARGQGDPASSLAIQFDKAVLKKGQEIPLRMVIQAMAAAPRYVPLRSPDPGAMPAGTAAAEGSPMGTSHPMPGSGNGSGSNPAGAAGGGVNGAEKATGPANDARGGLDSSGRLTAKSHGVMGLEDLHLTTDASRATAGSLITTSGKSVHLDGGIRLLLVSE